MRRCLPIAIFTGPELARHVLVDDDPALRVGRILFVEEPASQERDAHRLQVIVRDRRARPPPAPSPGGGFGWPTTSNDVADAETRQREPADRAGRRRLPAARRLAEKTGEELRTLPVSSIPRARKRQPHRHGVRWIETGIDVEQMLEAPHQQAGADQQHERQRDLDDDERAARAIPARRGSRAAAFLERVVQAGLRRRERGNELRRPGRRARDAPSVKARTQPSMPTSSRRWMGSRSATTARSK